MTKKDSDLLNRKTALAKPAALIGILLLVLILFDPISLFGNFIEQRKSLSDLATAKALWESKGIASYKIKVRGMVPLGCIFDAILTVHNGELVDVQSRSFDEDSDYVVVDKQNWGTSTCNFTELNIPQVLSNANEILNNINPVNERFLITFDSTYGFVTRYQYSYNSYGLLTSVVVSDCCAWYEFSNFQPIK